MIDERVPMRFDSLPMQPRVGPGPHTPWSDILDARRRKAVDSEVCDAGLLEALDPDLDGLAGGEEGSPGHINGV